MWTIADLGSKLWYILTWGNPEGIGGLLNGVVLLVLLGVVVWFANGRRRVRNRG